MFEAVDDAAVVDTIAASSREQSAACGRELMAIGELYARRAPDDDDERTNWAIDGHANVVAEIAAALNISRGERPVACTTPSTSASACPRSPRSSRADRSTFG